MKRIQHYISRRNNIIQPYSKDTWYALTLEKAYGTFYIVTNFNKDKQDSSCHEDVITLDVPCFSCLTTSSKQIVKMKNVSMTLRYKRYVDTAEKRKALRHITIPAEVFPMIPAVNKMSRYMLKCNKKDMKVTNYSVYSWLFKFAI